MNAGPPQPMPTAALRRVVAPGPRDEGPQVHALCSEDVGDGSERPTGGVSAEETPAESSLTPRQARNKAMQEEWRRWSLPFWRQRLKEARDAGDEKVVEYAEWMIRKLEEHDE